MTSGGLGYMRPAPGTWGSLPPAGIVFLMLVLGAPAWTINATLIVVLVISCAICVRFGEWAEGHFGKKDASPIVIDETAGQCLSLMAWPAAFIEECRAVNGAGAADWNAAFRGAVAVGGAFVLFRIFDIIKPPPARGLQRLHAGWGVLIDDLFAGAYAAAVVQVALRNV